MTLGLSDIAASVKKTSVVPKRELLRLYSRVTWGREGSQRGVDVALVTDRGWCPVVQNGPHEY
ncbi:hypothetical protein NSI01_13800 [Pimelobacter simplex]|nr:hypothetical protein NSI01_13800 [Pimelobacter simplex]